MDQTRIGKFILELRKESGMTQLELANKIGVTDRAISKWENGRGLPDLSLLKPLCDVFEITINELISGKKIDKNEYQVKVDETILNTIDYSNKKIKRNSKKFKIIISLILIVVIMIILMFLTDVRQMNQNKPVIFSTWGFDYTPAINLYDDYIYLTVKEFLVRKGDSEIKYHNGEKTFVSMKVYLLEEEKSNLSYYVYAWVREGKYYVENDEIKEASGSSIPYKFKVEKISGFYQVTGVFKPRDGSYYKLDMKKIFPKSVIDDMENVHTDGTVQSLTIELKEQAKLYFHK